jgi:hypothetical protein
MHPFRVSIALAGVLLAVAAGAADAYTCYVVLDAKETVIYRDTRPPVDLSDRGAAERDALRKKGNYLLAMETERCVPLGFGSGWTTSSEAPAPDYLSNVRSITASGEGAVARAPGIQPAQGTAATPARSAAPRRAQAPPAN